MARAFLHLLRIMPLTSITMEVSAFGSPNPYVYRIQCQLFLSNQFQKSEPMSLIAREQPNVYNHQHFALSETINRPSYDFTLSHGGGFYIFLVSHHQVLPFLHETGIMIAPGFRAAEGMSCEDIFKQITVIQYLCVSLQST